MPEICRHINNDLKVRILDYDPETEMEVEPTFICDDCKKAMRPKHRAIIYWCPDCEEIICISFEKDLREKEGKK